MTLQRGGVCIDDGSFIDAEILPDHDDGRKYVSGQIHRGWDETSPDCPPDSNRTPDCEIVEQLAATPLSPEQEAQLEALVAALPPGCLPLPADPACGMPCSYTIVLINGVTHQHDACSPEPCPGYFDAVDTLVDFIDGLVPP